MDFRSSSASRSLVAAVAIVGCLASSAAAAPPGAGDRSAFQGTVDSADYTVSPRVGQPRTKFFATLTNTGTSTIEVGRAFAVARLTPDGWRRLRHGRNCAWPSDARIIRPGDSYTQRVGLLGSECHFKALEPGRYRAVKWLRYTDGTSGARDDVVRARFRVER